MDQTIDHAKFPDFLNKLVSLYLTNATEERGVVLDNPTFELQGGRLFLIGNIAEGTTENDWAAGIPSAVAWDRVEQYLIFDSLEDYLFRTSLAWDKQAVQ